MVRERRAGGRGGRWEGLERTLMLRAENGVGGFLQSIEKSACILSRVGWRIWTPELFSFFCCTRLVTELQQSFGMGHLLVSSIFASTFNRISNVAAALRSSAVRATRYSSSLREVTWELGFVEALVHLVVDELDKGLVLLSELHLEDAVVLCADVIGALLEKDI